MSTLNDLYIRHFLSNTFEIFSREFILLDLGCGNQPYRQLCKQYLNNIISVDRYNRYGKLSLIADAQTLPFKSDSFHVVLFSEVIEHILDPQMAISEISRVVKTNGYLLLTLPFMYPLHECPNDYSRFTEFFVGALLEQNGFEILQFKRRGNLFSVLHVFCGQLFSNIIELIRRVPLLKYFFMPLGFILDNLIILSYKLHFTIDRKFKSRTSQHIGEGMRGPVGSLSLWTLGYCLLARKK